MVEFDLQLFGDPRLFGLIAAHGFVDFASPSLLAVYALAAVPLGSIPTTAGFLALSLLHFGRDLGPALSLGMHSLVGLVYLLDQNVAFSLMMAYSLVYHIPGLYVRLASTRQFVALSLALSASVAGFVAAGLRPVRAALPLLREGHLHFSHLMQRIVICHIVVHELAHANMSLPATLRAVRALVGNAARGARARARGAVGALRNWRSHLLLRRGVSSTEALAAVRDPPPSKRTGWVGPLPRPRRSGGGHVHAPPLARAACR